MNHFCTRNIIDILRIKVLWPEATQNFERFAKGISLPKSGFINPKYIGVGGGAGQVELCDVISGDKLLCSHHNITAKTNNPAWYCHDKYLKFQLKFK